MTCLFRNSISPISPRVWTASNIVIVGFWKDTKSMAEETLRWCVRRCSQVEVLRKVVSAVTRQISRERCQIESGRVSAASSPPHSSIANQEPCIVFFNDLVKSGVRKGSGKGGAGAAQGLSLLCAQTFEHWQSPRYMSVAYLQVVYVYNVVSQQEPMLYLLQSVGFTTAGESMPRAPWILRTVTGPFWLR